MDIHKPTVLLFLNDDFEGGEFIVSELRLNINKGDAIIFLKLYVSS